MSPLPYPMPNFLMWLEAGIVLGPVLVEDRTRVDDAADHKARREVQRAVLV